MTNYLSSNNIYKNLKRNNFDLKEFLKDLYKRRNKIAHQNDRDHENAIKQDISKDFVLEKITYLKTFVNEIHNYAINKDNK